MILVGGFKMKGLILVGIVFLFLVSSVFAVECGSVPTDGCTVSVDTTFEPGSYILPNGIRVSGSDINLDCNGVILSGGDVPQYFGIEVSGNGNTIKNCVLTGYNNVAPIIIRGSGHKIINNTVENGARESSIYVLSDNTEVINNTINNTNNVGISVHYEGAVLKGNNIKNSRWGVYINWAYPGEPVIKDNN